jgi:hypothetical protein
MPLVAATIALSAFLLFLVQPIIAKQILPWFGGTSAVWTTCMVFFQVLLLGGYAYAHALTRHASSRNQARIHIALLAASLLFLPILAREALKPGGEEDAAAAIIVLLAATIGLPYFLLSSTGPLLQRWVAHRFPEKTVYRLFALSNFGSLIGLLSFPFLIEPFAPSIVQAYVWSGAYALFALACAATAWQAQRADMAKSAATSESAVVDCAATDAQPMAERAPTAGDYLLWLTLAALGSVVLLAATSHITQNIASVPFLWVLPLTLYLLTFVLAFEGRGGRGWYERRWWLFPTLLLLVAMSWGLSAQRGVLDIGLAVPLYCLGLFFACMFCHGELAHAKPAPRYLTQFYLTLSLGGALGGLAVGLIAPRVFPAYFELPLALFALAALASWLVGISARPAPSASPSGRPGGLSLGNRTLLGPALVASAATAYAGWQYVDFVKEDIIVMQRSFYGTLRVRETGRNDNEVRRLLHGVILHGEQFTTAADRLEPGTYYGRSSGIGLAIADRQAQGPVRLGLVGLGVGTLAAYGRAGDLLRFYELDPHVVELAQRHFTYLGATPAKLEFEIGDARLSMERELKRNGPRRYDVLAIDAFSSDSIPVHLITREAIEVYAQHLAPDGIIAIHISNRFLDLKPVLGNIAQVAGLAARLVSDSPDEDRSASSTDWVLLARDPAVFDAEPLAGKAEPLATAPQYSLWTDQFNNLLDVLKLRPLAELKTLLGVD